MTGELLTSQSVNDIKIDKPRVGLMVNFSLDTQSSIHILEVIICRWLIGIVTIPPNDGMEPEEDLGLLRLYLCAEEALFMIYIIHNRWGKHGLQNASILPCWW